LEKRVAFLKAHRKKMERLALIKMTHLMLVTNSN
jgi:hypothetical protein